ncbi:MAG TPA: hypothetical protein VLE93_01330 [Candidatus Saccharimonadales bacterium]|nr:hypothetical protein [Candidatus Saccharimonadales bacterium]
MKDNKEIVEITYSNYRGETGTRQIIPKKIWFGATEYHPDEQWLLDAFDVTKKADRTFALKDITSWQ